MREENYTYGEKHAGGDGDDDDFQAVFHHHFNIVVKCLIKTCVTEVLKEDKTSNHWFIKRTNINQIDGDATADYDAIVLLLLDEKRESNMLSFFVTAKDEAFRKMKIKAGKNLAFAAEVGRDVELQALQKLTIEETAYNNRLNRKLNEVTSTLLKQVIRAYERLFEIAS